MSHWDYLLRTEGLSQLAGAAGQPFKLPHIAGLIKPQIESPLMLGMNPAGNASMTSAASDMSGTRSPDRGSRSPPSSSSEERASRRREEAEAAVSGLGSAFRQVNSKMRSDEKREKKVWRPY